MGLSARIGTGLAAAAGLGLIASGAHAMTAHDFVDAYMDDIFGSYAPHGDCSRGPVITIDRTGFTYDVGGRKTHPASFETAYSFWGNSYEGIQKTFFPFPRSEDDYGASMLTVNADEVEGKIAFENSGPAPVSAVQQALAKASPYMRCGPAPAKKPVTDTPPAIPLDWASLPKVAGSFDVPFEMFGQGEIANALRALLGDRIDALETNLSVASAIQRQGPIYYISGNAPHLGGEEQAYVLMDPARKRVQVGLWEKGKLTVYAPPSGRLPLPTAIVQLLDQSPPENAVALPGTPWEIVPAEGQGPLAYVAAAGSPLIQSLSLFCDQGRPKLAMLLHKAPPDAAMTLTWVFNGRTVNVAMGRGNAEATFWLGYLDNSPLPQMLVNGSGIAYLRINGVMEGQASLAGSTATVRNALRACARL